MQHAAQTAVRYATLFINGFIENNEHIYIYFFRMGILSCCHLRLDVFPRLCRLACADNAQGTSCKEKSAKERGEAEDRL